MVCKECEHEYRYTLRRIFTSSSILGKKKCEKCGETIVLSTKYRIAVIVYVIIFAAILVVAIKQVPNILKEITVEERIGIVMPIFITVYVAGLYVLLNKAKHVSAKKKSDTRE